MLTNRRQKWQCQTHNTCMLPKWPEVREYQGKLLEARQSDWKDEAVLIILSLPVAIFAWAVVSDDPTAMDKVKLFFEMFSQLPSWFTNLWILVVASIYGIKGTQIFRNGGKKNNGKEKE